MSNLKTAVETLCQVIDQGANLDRALEEVASGTHKPLIQQLCYGVLREYYALEEILNKLLRKPLATKHSDIKILLMAGIYQISNLNIPDYAAVNESVAAAESLGKGWAKGLVNAILRNYIRSGPELIANLSRESRLNHPGWLIEGIENQYPEHFEEIIEANNTQAPMTLRVNLAKTSRQDYLMRLERADMAATPCPYASTGVMLAKAVAVNQLPGFEEGWVSIQDEASQLVIPLLELAPGQRVLDACAAPGGKTCHALESQAGLGRFIAVENNPVRAEKLASNLRRLKLSCDLIVEDVKAWDCEDRFDRILLDAPCSATGIIRRHPDIKLHRRETDIDQYSNQQLELLTSVWKKLAPGGMLVYTTCSVLAQENQQVIAAFLENTIDTEIQLIPADWGLDLGVGRILLPKVRGNDGFFYARLKKKPQ